MIIKGYIGKIWACYDKNLIKYLKILNSLSIKVVLKHISLYGSQHVIVYYRLQLS